MATQNTVNIGVNVSDNGTAKKVVKSFQEIEQAANRAQKAARNTMSAGGTAGSRAVYAKANPTGSQAIMSGEDYGRARGSAGATGAGARDFANQAQGLGGLVRLYATYAANVFAVGAAFTALKNAADTTNLVRGLDTLGAASGKSLGSLSKRLVEVTDGAISMRESMTAVAQSSSAGMSSKNIERLAVVAKNASLALGVSMPDALSRLSRGITKLEPELIDELGLFTKIGPATEKYALEVGKSVSSLSDFERRQAFANAVLEEGEKKFGALAEAAANPYDKLLSSLKNVLQSGGELINKVLVPIVSLLANSPSALTAVLTGIGYILLKQAIPAIGQLRAGLRNTAEDALKASIAFKESFGDEFQTILEKRFKIPDLEAGIKKAEADLAKVKFGSKMPVSIQKITEGELNQTNVNKALATRNALIDTGMRGSKKASEAQIAAAKEEVLYIQKAIDLYRQREALTKAREGTEEVAGKKVGRFDPEVIALQKYEKLRTKVAMADAIANAAQVSSIAGIRASWGLLNKEIAEKGITGFSKFSTLAQGGLAAVGTRVMGIVGSLGQVGQVIAIGVAGFMALDSWLSKNVKQAERFNSALVTAEESVANVSRTLSAATTLEGIATSTIANTVAFSTALNELSGSLTEIIKLARETDKASGKWDNFWDSVFSVVDKDRASKLAKTVASQIQSSISLLAREGLAEEYSAELKKILGVKDLSDFEAVSTAFKNLRKDQQDAVVAIQNNSNRALGNAGSALQSFKDKTDEALKAQKVLTNSFMDSSPAFKYGESLVQISTSLSELEGQGPKRVAQALEEISTNMEKGAMFGKEFVGQFAPIADQFAKQKTNIDASRNALVIYNQELTNAQSNLQKFGDRPNKNFVRVQQAEAAVENASENVRLAAKALANAPREVYDQGIKMVGNIAKSTFERGMAFIDKAIRDAQNTAAITIGKVLASNLTGPQKLQADAALAQQDLKAKLANIQISEDLLSTQDMLVNEMKLANALQAEANVLQKNAGKTGPQVDLQNANASKAVAKARFAVTGDTTGLDPDEIAAEEARKRSAQDLKRKGTQAARIAVTGDMRASQLGLASELPGAQLAQAEELKKINDKINTSMAARRDVAASIAGITNAEIIAAKQKQDLETKAGQQAREIEAINEKIAQAERNKAAAIKQGGEAGKTIEKQQDSQIKFLTELKNKTESAQKADTSVDIAKNRQELLAQELVDIGTRFELVRSNEELQKTAAQNSLDIRNQELELYSSAYNMSQQYNISRKTALDNEAALLEANRAMQAAQDMLNQKREEAETRIQALKANDPTNSGATIAAIAAINEETARQETLTNNTIAGLGLQYNARVAMLAKSKEINLEQERYNQLIQETTGFAESLKEVFGTIGEKLGNVASTFAEVAVNTEKRAKAELKLDADLAESKKKYGEDSEKYKELEADASKEKKKNARAEMSDNIKLIGSAKNLFKEKTAAYKILAGIEKAMHLYKMAMFVKEVGMEMWAMGKSVYASITKTTAKTAEAGVDGVAAVVKAIASVPFPLNLIAGAATAAVVTSLLAKLGGSGVSVSGGAPTSEQRQETQGTAMAYNEMGQKVQVRRGVFGDENAKSESIAKSLEIIRDNSIDGLSYDNKMLRALENLNQALNSAAKGLFGIKGLRAGSLSGIVEGTNTSGGFLGIGGLFSKSVSKSIIDSGLQLKGTFYDLANGVRGTINTFETVSTTVKKSGFFGIGGSTKTSVSTEFKDLYGIDPKAFDSLVNIFNFAADTLYSVAETAGVSSDAVSNALRSISIDEMASLRGLTGDEFTKELSAVVGSVLDDASLVIFSSFEKYANFGEGMLETVIRVVDTNKKIDQALKNMGLAFDVSKDYTETINGVTKFFGFTIGTWSATIGMTSKDITEALAKAAGGLDKFLDQAEYFRKNFLTEAEQLAPVQQAVTAEMSRLGFSSVDTREEFKALVQSLNLSTTSGIETYQALMNVSEGFIRVTEEAKKESEERSKLEEQLLKLGASKEALRELELEGLYEGNRELQREIWLKEDQISAAKALQSNLQNVTKTIRSQITSLQDYKLALQSGSNSTLTATQQYTLARSEVDKLVTTITKAATTPEEIEARSTAIGKLSSATDKFLGMSRGLYASGAQYTTDFNTVMSIINSVSSGLETQLTDAEKQLSVLEASNTFLESISETSKSTAQLLQTYLSLGGAPLNTPGFAVGTNYVPHDMVAKIHQGERIIPMADNFKLMTSLASNDNYSREMVVQIRNLNQKIDSLEKTVAEGAVINAQATERNTEQIAQAVVDSSGKTIQANRLQARAGIK